MAKPSFFTASEQFHNDDKDLLNVLLLDSFPVLIIIVLCFPISFVALVTNDFDIEAVDDGCPTAKSYTPFEFAMISIASMSNFSENFQIARKFSEKFDILAIEIIANSNGMYDLAVGHPSSTDSISKSFRTNATKDIGKHKTMIISTGKESSNNTLTKSLSSLWNCSDAVKDDGLAVLLAECKLGVGSDGIQSFMDGRMNIDRLKKPSQYTDGMENLLYITEIQKKFQLGLLSILPTHYTKKLGMKPFNGIKQVMDYILKNQGQKQKVEVISDGARTLLG